MGQEKSERERKYPTLFLLSNEREENPTISTCIATLIRELPLVQVLGYIRLDSHVYNGHVRCVFCCCQNYIIFLEILSNQGTKTSS